MQLLELQRTMLAELRQPTAPEDNPAAAAYLRPGRRLSARERLGIYHRSYWARLRQSLAEDFPALRAVVGRRRFAALLDAYLIDHPSHSWTLRDLGQHLPAWLDQHREQAGRRWRAALDAARLEWAYVEAYDVAALPPIVADFHADSRFCLQPHLRLLPLSFSVDELLPAVHRDGRTQPLPRLRRERVWLAVHRADDLVYYRRLDPIAFTLLQSLGSGLPLGQALPVACAAAPRGNSPESTADAIHAALALATQFGWLCSPPDASPA